MDNYHSCWLQQMHMTIRNDNVLQMPWQQKQITNTNNHRDNALKYSIVMTTWWLWCSNKFVQNNCARSVNFLAENIKHVLLMTMYQIPKTTKCLHSKSFWFMNRNQIGLICDNRVAFSTTIKWFPIHVIKNKFRFQKIVT